MSRLSVSILTVLALTLTACGGTTSTTPNLPTAPNPIPDGTLTGFWTGTTSTPTLGTIETDLQLTQNGDRITGDFFLFLREGEELATTLDGAVTGSVITIITEIPLNDEIVTFAYQGTLSGTTLAGQVTVAPDDGSGNQERGQFALSKRGQP